MKTEKKINILELADEIIHGRRIKKEDDLDIFINSNLNELCVGADKIRKNFVGDYVDLCSIINAKSGNCYEDCKFCAQSVYNKTGCKIYDLLDEKEILKKCKENEEQGVDRFCIVTSGRALLGEEFERVIDIFKTLKKNCNISLCASMGFLGEKELEKLFNAGVTTFHHNIETSERNFKNICSTHTFEMKLKTLKLVQKVGLKRCSGVIIGMGETIKDRLDMALTLAEIGVESIPINVLIPIKGTAFQNTKILKEEEILRTISFFRYINPKALIRLAAGRDYLTNFGEFTFKSGASAMIVKNMLTSTVNSSVENDKEMLRRIGRITKN